MRVKKNFTNFKLRILLKIVNKNFQSNSLTLDYIVRFIVGKNINLTSREEKMGREEERVQSIKNALVTVSKKSRYYRKKIWYRDHFLIGKDRHSFTKREF